MTTQGETRKVGPLHIGDGKWNQLLDVANAYAGRALSEVLPMMAEVGTRIALSETEAQRVAVAGESSLLIMRELMVAVMCGFRLATTATVIRESDEGIVEFLVGEAPGCPPRPAA
jgi:hypothetical protein